MKKLILVVALLAAGCHSLTTAEVTEVRDNAAAGKRLLDKWKVHPETKPSGTISDFVFAFTRTSYNILWTTQGEKPPAEFAPVTSE